MKFSRILFAFALTTGIGFAQARPQFEVASIRRCAGDDNFTGINISADRLSIGCLPLETLISMAYLEFSTGHRDPFYTGLIEGGPAWIHRSANAADSFAINARAPGATSAGMMQGPMMQALLEDRFQLKIHHETRQVRVYALTIGKGTPRLKAFDGSCIPYDPTLDQQPQPQTDGKPQCSGGNMGGPNRFNLNLRGVSMALFADRLDTILERTRAIDGLVVNRTGLESLFDIKLEFSIDSGASEAGSTDAPPSVFTALQDQLNLRLERATGSREVVVIDRIERPSDN